MSWVLVMILLRDGIDLQPVYGFESEAACGAAGEKLVAKIEEVGYESHYFCLKQSAP